MEGWGAWGGGVLLWREEEKKGRGWRGLFFRGFFFYSRGQISRHSGGREAGREVGGRLAEERWRGRCRWTVYWGQRRHWRALHLLRQLPWFLPLTGENGAERAAAAAEDSSTLTRWAERRALYVDNLTQFSFYSALQNVINLWCGFCDYFIFIIICLWFLLFFLPWLVLLTFTF